MSLRACSLLLALAFVSGAGAGWLLGTHRTPPPLRYQPAAHSAQFDPTRPRPKTLEERVAQLIERRLLGAGQAVDAALLIELTRRYINHGYESYPMTGVLTSAFHEDAAAPLAIKTRPGGGYFVKLIEVPSNRTAMTAFVNGGVPFETDVPLGSYELRYAAGSEWYGSVLDFGPTASYFRSPERFHFTATQDGYRGYTVELILQEGGNLHTTEIDAEEF